MIISTEGKTPTLVRLHSDEFKAEYNELRDADSELEEIVARHSENRSNINRQCVTAKARILDVSNTCQAIQQLVSTLFLCTLCFSYVRKYYGLEYVCWCRGILLYYPELGSSRSWGNPSGSDTPTHTGQGVGQDSVTCNIYFKP